MKSSVSLFKSLLLIAFLTDAAAGIAQVSFAPRVGLQIARVNSSSSLDIGSRFGVSAGATMDIRLGRCSLQPALAYVQRGAVLKSKEVAYENTSRPNSTYIEYAKVESLYKLDYLELPVTVVYTASDQVAGNGFQAAIGLYAAVGIRGTNIRKTEYRAKQRSNDAPTRTESSSGPISFTNDITSFTASGHYVRNTDFGGQIGLGYRYHNAQLQALYQIGLTPLEPTIGGRRLSRENQHRIIQLTLNYFLPSKKAA